MPKMTNSEIHELLAKRREIAIIWSIEDVKEVRPDLNARQAWRVLQQCWRLHDATIGLDLDLIKRVSIEMFPDSKEGAMP